MHSPIFLDVNILEKSIEGETEKSQKYDKLSIQPNILKLDEMAI